MTALKTRDMLDCVSQVEASIGKLPEAVRVLYNNTSDRASGWKTLVQAAKGVGEQTSKLLVVVYGAGMKRFEQAGRRALAALAKFKTFCPLPADELAPVRLALDSSAWRTSLQLSMPPLPK